MAIVSRQILAVPRLFWFVTFGCWLGIFDRVDSFVGYHQVSLHRTKRRTLWSFQGLVYRRRCQQRFDHSITSHIRLHTKTHGTTTSSKGIITSSSSTQPLHSPILTQSNTSQWLNYGILFSSFTDGIKPNIVARDFIQQCLVRSLLIEQLHHIEEIITTSAKTSPCCGPNLRAVERMEMLDEALHRLNNNCNMVVNNSTEMWQNYFRVLQQSDTNDDHGQHDEITIRVVYIPTALYALRADSNNTPGKQRQRARADGKKRRNNLVQYLATNVLVSLKQVPILAVTLDLDDGSIKQPETTASKGSYRFPKSGKEALNDWNPHLVYVEGGNTFWLYHCIVKGNWKQDLGCLLTSPDKTTLCCGASAGAIVMGASMATACWKRWDDPSAIPGMETYDHWKNVPGLGWVGNHIFFPHMDSSWNHVVATQQQFVTPMAVRTLAEDEICCITGRNKHMLFVSPSSVVESDALS